MKNRLFTSLLALLVLGISAAFPSMAMGAPTFTAASYPATVTLENATGGTWTDEGGKVECATNKVHGILSAASSTFSAHPTYSNCAAFGFLGASINTEGCDLVFQATEKVAMDEYSVHAALSCPAGQSIKVSSGTCAMEVKPQTGLTGMSLKNDTGTSVLTATLSITGISYVVTKDGFGCPYGGTGIKVGATYVTDEPLAPQGSSTLSVSG